MGLSGISPSSHPDRHRRRARQRRATRGATWPPPVHPGDRVGVAALSGPVDPARLAYGLDALRALGLEPVEAANLRQRCGLFAGDDQARLDAFHQLAADPSLRAIFFARGGHGVLRLLPRLDWTLLRRTPRAYVGYSDLTPFLLQVVERLGLVAFHGPMVAADLARGLDAVERASLLETLAPRATLRLPVAGGRGAATEGRLLGGCLSLLTALLGTPYAPSWRGALLVLEEIDEPPYRLDRMLTHLGLSGTLAEARGMIFGHLARHGEASSADVWQPLLRDLAPRFSGAIAWGLQVGHVAPNRTLPLGAWGRLDPAGGQLEIEVAARR